MAANEHLLSTWLPSMPFAQPGFAGGCLGDEREGGEGGRETRRRKRTQRGAVTPRTSSALRWEPLSSQHRPIKERALQRGGGGGGGGGGSCVVLRCSDVHRSLIHRCLMDFAMHLVFLCSVYDLR